MHLHIRIHRPDLPLKKRILSHMCPLTFVHCHVCSQIQMPPYVCVSKPICCTADRSRFYSGRCVSATRSVRFDSARCASEEKPIRFDSHHKESANSVSPGRRTWTHGCLHAPGGGVSSGHQPDPSLQVCVVNVRKSNKCCVMHCVC